MSTAIVPALLALAFAGSVQPTPAVLPVLDRLQPVVRDLHDGPGPQPAPQPSPAPAPLIQGEPGNQALVAGAVRIPIADETLGVRVAQAGVPVRIPVRLVARLDAKAVEILAKAGAIAKTAAISIDLELTADPLLGWCLRGDKTLVLAEGALFADAPVEGKDAGNLMLQKVIADKVAPVRKAIAEAPEAKRPTQDAIKAMDDLFGILHRGKLKRAIDEVTPDLARRIVLSGMVRQLCPDTAAVKALEAAVAEAMRMKVVESFTGTEGKDQLRYEKVQNAYGQGGWCLRTPTRTAFEVPFGELYMASEDTRLQVVVDLPTGSDPVKDAAKALSAKAYADDGGVVVSWGPAGFNADVEAWRRQIDGKYANAPANAHPPHLALHTLGGDLVLLATPYGTLRSGAKPEEFLANAAKILPDTAHMDLLAQHAFRYVYDSPDPRFPLIPGSKSSKGEYHSTAAQSIESATGGLMRGDCDDFAELTQAVAERQKRLAYAIVLPSHTGCAFATKIKDGWEVNLLQTGPALSFTAGTLPEALAKCYTSFDESEPFNPNQLGLLLRFSGENQRGSWRLSWRIFAEPDYARTMIDVQRDWQYQTYARGISKMQKMVAAGDKDPANYSELSGLYSFTGQWEKAVEFENKSIDATKDPADQLQLKIEQLMRLKSAGKIKELEALAKEIIEVSLPALKDKLGEALIQTGIQLAETLLTAEQPVLAARALEATSLDTCRNVLAQTAMVAKSPQMKNPRFQEQWRLNSQLQMFRKLSSMWAGLAIQMVEKSEPSARESDPVIKAAQDDGSLWIAEVAFRDVDDAGDIAQRYASAAHWWIAAKGRDVVLADLGQVELPKPKSKVAHTERAKVADLYQRDLPWIKASVAFWLGELALAVDPKADAKPDGERALMAAKAGVAAAEWAVEDQSEDAQGIIMAQTCRLAAAVLADDDATLRTVLRQVKEFNDKRQRDSAAQWLGDLAPLVTADRFNRVIDAWEKEVDYKPKWFWIAWRAALSGAADRALAVAKRAAKRYNDDPSFGEEARFMEDLNKQGLLGVRGK